jgi:segregation and condensation protein B
MSDSDAAAENARDSQLSLSRLRQAFAAMLEGPNVATSETGAASAVEELAAQTAHRVPKSEDAEIRHARDSASAACEINPRSVVEAILFVGRPDNHPLSARELAAAMRGVSPTEIDAAIRELNALYDADETPYHIETSSSGYRLALRGEWTRMRDKFYGRVREAKLSAAAIEVLSIVAYNQPITAHEINELRSAANGAALSTLVRRQLIRQERPAEGGPPRYVTAERFLKLFDLECLEALPRSEELEKA